MVADWSTRPFVDIRLENFEAGGCALDYEPIFSRMWNGTHELCVDGLDVRVFNYDDELDICDGDIRSQIKPINMTIDSGMIVCGKRGGPTFMETSRVDPITKQCSRGLVPCSKTSPPRETVCVKEYEREFECPILDLFIVKESNIP